jgi:hypothetical protein
VASDDLTPVASLDLESSFNSSWNGPAENSGSIRKLGLNNSSGQMIIFRSGVDWDLVR